jgi:hypothetical protein
MFLESAYSSYTFDVKADVGWRQSLDNAGDFDQYHLGDYFTWTYGRR